jgi:hypothetical protein
MKQRSVTHRRAHDMGPTATLTGIQYRISAERLFCAWKTHGTREAGEHRCAHELRHPQPPTSGWRPQYPGPAADLSPGPLALILPAMDVETASPYFFKLVAEDVDRLVALLSAIH